MYLLNGELNVGLVLLGDGWQIDLGTGQVASLATAEHTTILHLADDRIAVCKIGSSLFENLPSVLPISVTTSEISPSSM